MRLRSWLCLHLLVLASCTDSSSGSLADWSSSRLDALGPPPANDANLTFSVSNLTPNANDRVHFSARAPVQANPALVAQTLDVSWDPHFLIYAAPTVPEKWATTYYMGDEQLEAPPTTAAGWNGVTRVVASGSYHSDGVVNGNQYILGESQGAATIAANFVGASAGDGWDLFFDDDHTRVFNIHHHDGPQTLMCRSISTGLNCPGYPYPLMHTDNRAQGYMDPINNRIWHPTWSPETSTTGFECVDLSGPTPFPCANRYVPAATGVSGGVESITGAAVVKRELYSLEFQKGGLVCLDLDTQQPCAGQPYLVSIHQGNMAFSDIKVVGGKIYWAISDQVGCFDPNTKAACANMSWPKVHTGNRPMLLMPNSAGTAIDNLCFESNCFAVNGNATTVNPNYITYAQTHGSGGNGVMWNKSETSGTRVFWEDRGWHVTCWDTHTSAPCTYVDNSNNVQPNWSIDVPVVYSPIIDPENPLCLWTNGDDGVVRTWDVITSKQNCKTPPPNTRFKPQVAVPRLGCDVNSRVASWDTFTLTNPNVNSFASASFSVTDASGQPVAGWQNVPLTNTPVDLTTLDVTQSSQKPVFTVTYVGLTDFSPATADFRVIGQAPEICFDANTTAICPATGGLPPASVSPTSAGNANATGSYVLDTNVSVDLNPNVVNFGALPNVTDMNSCVGNLKGHLESAGYVYVPNATVYLLRGDGTLVEDGSAAPVTAMSNPTGDYNFTTLLLGRYKIRVGDANGYQVQSSLVVTGASGNSNYTVAANGNVTSKTVTVAPSVPGVVNAKYSGTEVCVLDSDCSLGICGSNNRCGLTNGLSGCTPQHAEICQSKVCGVAGYCVPPYGCWDDNDCVWYQHCVRNDGKGGALYCDWDKPNGTPIQPNDALHPDGCSSAAAWCGTGKCNTRTITCGGNNGDACTDPNECAVDICGSKGYCGISFGDGPCLTDPTQCQQGRCSTADVCIPWNNGCYVDTECGNGAFCSRSNFQCTGVLPSGTALPTGGLHSSTCDPNDAKIVCAGQMCNPNTNTCASGLGAACNGASVCFNNACDANNHLCGWQAGTGPCDPNYVGSQCQSGHCSAHGGVCVTADPNSCWVDSDCDPNSFCKRNTFTCTAKLAEGAAISSDTLHDGSCTADNANAVCVSGLCNAVASTCGLPNSGTCTNPNQCAFNLCNAHGTCGVETGSAGCTVSNAGTVCQSGHCSTNAGVCVPTATGCYVDSECSASQFCARSTYTCTTLEASGTALPSDGLHDSCPQPYTNSACESGTCNPNTTSCVGPNGSTACSAGQGPSTCITQVCGADHLCGCALDSDCGSGTYCDFSTRDCVPRVLPGVDLPSDGLHDGSCNPTDANRVCSGHVCNPNTVTCANAIAQPCGNPNGCIGNVCDTNNLCGYAEGHGPCDANNASVICQSGHCSPHGNTCLATDPAGCWVDNDCDPNSFCKRDTFACTTKLLPGVAISNDTLHDGTCTAANANAVCASALCNATTHTCALANSGACTADNECVYDLCNANGTCGVETGSVGCTVSNAGTVCQSGHCSTHAGVCVPTATGCFVDSDCSASQFCARSTYTCTTLDVSGTALPSDGLHDACPQPYTNSACVSGTCNPNTLSCVGPNGTTACAAGAGPQTCVSQVCGQDGHCGLADDEAGCTPSNGSVVCRSTACSPNSTTCIPQSGNCWDDSDCSDAQYCARTTHTCTARQAVATTLPSDGLHATCPNNAQNHACASGLCRGSLCVGVNTTTPCTAPSSCLSGACDADGHCGYASSSGPCDASNANTVCRSGACGGVSHVCIPTQTSCAVDGECDGTQYCHLSDYTCASALATGSVLPSDGLHDACPPDHANPACATGLCNASTGSCVAVNRTGECTQNADCLSSVCGGGGKCGYGAGEGPCDAGNANTVCRSGVCELAQGVCVAPKDNGQCSTDTDCTRQWCDPVQAQCTAQLADGTAIPNDTLHGGLCSKDVAAFVCASGSCSTVTNRCALNNTEGCTKSSDCASNICFPDGQCGMPSNTECKGDDDCRSGSCVDGVCTTPEAITRGNGLFDGCNAVPGQGGGNLATWLLCAAGLLRIARRRAAACARPLVPAVAAAVLLLALPAQSAEKGFGLDRYTPAPAGSRWLVLDSLEVPDTLRRPEVVSGLALRLSNNWAHDPLVVAFSKSLVGNVIAVQSTLDLGASLHLDNHWRIAADIPVQIYSSGKSLTDHAYLVPTSKPIAGMGDVRLGATFYDRISDTRARYGFSLTGRFPSGNPQAYAGDGVASGILLGHIAGDLDNLAWAVQAGGRLRPTGRFASSPLGSEVLLAGAIAFQTVDRSWLVGLEVPTSAVVTDGNPFRATTLSVEPGITGAWLPARDLSINAGVSTGLTTVVGAPNWRIMVAAQWWPLAAEPVVAPPSPPPPAPAPALVEPPPPEPVPVVAPAPPAAPAPAPVAPPPPPPEPVPAPPPPPPAEPDRDNDGVPDKVDNCPDKPGTAANQGCDKPQRVSIRDGKLVLAGKIVFDTGKDTLRKDKDSFDLLDNVVEVLKAHPEVLGMRVEGHTDAKGNAAKNLDLSDRRAKTVVRYLTDHGLEAKRFTSKGFGQTQPIDTNDTDAGRANNRRVEFILLDKAP